MDTDQGNTVIRPATEADMPTLLAMGQRFFDASGYGDLMAFDPISLEQTLRTLIAGDGVCLVALADGAIAGFAGALAYPFYFNTAHRTGQELFWWLNPEQRGSRLGVHLLDALEDWAKSAGCQTFSMIALDAVNAEKVGAIYKRRGYRASEHSYIKEL